VGFTLGPAEWVREVIKIQSQSATHAASMAQRGAIAALTGSQESVAEMLVEYQRRGAWLVPALNAIPGIECSMPEGAFYAFPNVRGLMATCGFATSKELADELLWKYGIVLTAGSAFGIDGYLRISYANSLEALQEAVGRIEQMVKDRTHA
jgi:aspartate aminotransferase